MSSEKKTKYEKILEAVSPEMDRIIDEYRKKNFVNIASLLERLKDNEK